MARWASSFHKGLLASSLGKRDTLIYKRNFRAIFICEKKNPGDKKTITPTYMIFSYALPPTNPNMYAEFVHLPVKTEK